MKVNAGDLDMGKERRKQRRDDGDSGERKKRCKKNDLELTEGDGRDSDWGKERGKRHRHHGSKEISRHRHHVSKEISRHGKKVSRKEKSREVDNHPYLSGGKKGNVESDSDDSERDKECSNWDMELFKGSESKGQYDTGRGSGWRRQKGDAENSGNASDGGKTTWHRDQFKGSARKERTCSNNSIRRENIDNLEEMIQSNFNSEDMKFIEDQGWEQNLDRSVPTRDCDEEYEEVKNDSKKRKSAWLIEEAEKQQLSPVTLSDVEFSASFDSRIGNREFIVAQDYCALKAEPEGNVYQSICRSHVLFINLSVEAMACPPGLPCMRMSCMWEVLANWYDIAC